MSARTDCIRHQDTWMERHVAESFLITVMLFTLISLLVIDSFFIGFAFGMIVASWMLVRCMAKDVYFTTVHRIRKENSHER